VTRYQLREICLVAAALLAGCRNDAHQKSPLAVSDYRLGAIEQRVSRLDPADIDDEMLAVDAEAYGRPAGAAFRDAVAKFYNAAHPACLAEPGETAEDDEDSVAATKAPIEDFDALVAGLALTPFRRDLDLAWERAALGGRKDKPSRACATGDETQHETLRDAQAAMRDALDRMESAINGSAG
jgi:hypothetical protein